MLVYRETNNAELVRQMLGHTSLAHTVAYLGMKGEDVSAMSRRFGDLSCQVWDGVFAQKQIQRRETMHITMENAGGYGGAHEKAVGLKNTDVYSG